MPEKRHGDIASSIDHWEISYAITRAFGEAADDNPPTAAILQLLTNRLKWDVAALWVVNELRLMLDVSSSIAGKNLLSRILLPLPAPGAFPLGRDSPEQCGPHSR